MNQTKLSETDDEGLVDLKALLLMLWGHKYLVVLSTFLGGMVALFIALIMTPTYRAEVSVVEVSHGGANGASSLVNQLGGLANLVGVNLGSGPANAGAEAQALLRSRRLAEEFIKRYSLQAALYPNNKEAPSLWFAVRHFRKDVLSVTDDKRNSMTVVAMTWIDPTVAARWANDYIALANELLRMRAIEESRSDVAYLNSQISQTNSVEIQRVMYNLIENETKTLMLANARSQYAFAVIDSAVPPEIRISPQRTFIVLIGLMIGFATGGCTVFVWSKIAPNIFKDV